MSGYAAIDYELKRDFVTVAAGGRAGEATAVVGAYVFVGVPGQSRVHVYDRLDPGAVPTPVMTIVSPNAAAGDDFGAALAPLRDTHLLIGAPKEDTPGGVDAGAAYLYDLRTGTPTLVHRYVRPSSPGSPAGANFGASLAGTFGGGFTPPTAVIGAPGDDADGTDSGALYTFSLAPPFAWNQRVPNPTPAPNDRFGAALVLYVRADFSTAFLVGAPNDNGAGAVHEFSLGSTTRDQTHAGAPGSLFGLSIALGPAIAGQLHFFVGAPGTSGASGAAHLVNEVTGAIAKTFLPPGGGGAWHLFGYSIARLNAQFAIGTPGANGAAGAVYVFANATNYPLLDTIPNPEPDPNDLFGISVGGENRLVVGAREHDVAGNDNNGAAYLFEPLYDASCSTAGTPSQIGEWGPAKSWPAVAVHAMLLHTPDHRGKVLFYQGFGNARGYLWDPVTEQLTNTGDIHPGFDLFCSGHVKLKDGRALLMGGTEFPTGGIPTTVSFNPATQTYTAHPDMAYERFYPTATALGDGRVLATEGTGDHDHATEEIGDHNHGSEPGGTLHMTTPELFDPALDCWREMTPTQTPPIKMQTYPFMFLLPDGKIFQAGRSIIGALGEPDRVTVPITRRLTLSIPDSACTVNGSAAYSPVSQSNIDGAAGSAVLYRAGEHAGRGTTTAFKVLKAGGLHAGVPTRLADRIDLTQSDAWEAAAQMTVKREHLNLVILPTGKVLAVGGTSDANDGGYPGVELSAEVWDPNAAPSGTWTPLACMSEPRMYHSTAMLLPDGRVLSAGGGPLINPLTVYPSFQVYEPPYMLAPSRPQIVASSVPPEATFLSSFDVDVANAPASEIDTVVFIRPAAVTHSFDQDQRYVPASFTVKDADTLTVTTPVNNKLAPAGYYMLFVVRDAVPSTAVFIRLDGGGCG